MGNLKPIPSTFAAAEKRGVKAPPKRKVFKNGHGREGAITGAEKSFIGQFVADQTKEVTSEQIIHLAKAMRRSPAAIRAIVEGAREDFAGNAQRYVDIHKQAAEAALAADDNETAAKAAQWALTNLSFEGKRVVEKEEVATTGSRILIGIKLGGVNQDALDLPAIEAEKVE